MAHYITIINTIFARHLLSVFLFFFTSHIAYSQSHSLEQRVSLQAQNESLENVLAEITKQTGVRFSYNSQLISPKTKVTVNAQNKTIKAILATTLPASVSFKKVGEHIVFYATPLKKNVLTNNITIPEPTPAENSEKSEKNVFTDNGKLTEDCLNSVRAPEDTVHANKDTISLTKEEEMKLQIAGMMMAVATASVPVATQATTLQKDEMTSHEITLQEHEIAPQDTVIKTNETQQPTTCRPAQLTFFYPLGTGFAKSAEKCYHFSINILGGVTGQLKGFEAGSLFNINKYGARGVQFAGLFNVTHACDLEKYSRNAQFAGLFNTTKQGYSVQFAGIFNRGDTAVFQAGGIFNLANESVAQFAGIFNHGNNALFQAAGVWNVSKKTKCQLAGVANIAQESYCQIAGVLNVTKKGRFQMGVINVRDTADGVSIGLINIVKRGGILEAGIEAGEFVHTAATFRSGTSRLYSIISVGYNYGQRFWSFGSGLGTSFKLIEKLSLNLELFYAELHNSRTVDLTLMDPMDLPYYSLGRKWNGFIQFSPVLHYRFVKHFKIYLGPSFNILIQGNGGILNPTTAVIKLNPPYRMYNQTFRNSMLDMWIGVVGGIKF